MLPAVLHTRIPRSVLVTAFFTAALCFYSMYIGQSMSAYFQGEISKISRRQEIAFLEHSPLRAAAPDAMFPAFECAIDPFGATPHWGSMRSNTDLNRRYKDIGPQEYIPAPDYDMATLTKPLKALNQQLHTAAAQDAITAKLFYSTRYMGPYDLDAAEYSILGHPAIDIKMPQGAPVRAVAGGRVYSVDTDTRGLGRYVVVEHRLPKTGERVFSIYGHMDEVIVQRGDNLRVGQMLGTVGNTGNSTRPHLQLQIDRYRGQEPHTPYVAGPSADRTEIVRWTMHPMDFIRNY